MKLRGDIKSLKLLKIKELLFEILGVTAAVLLMMQSPTFQTALLLAIAIWAFCRFYYFLFDVLEHYAGQGPCAGLWDAPKTLFQKTQK